MKPKQFEDQRFSTGRFGIQKLITDLFHLGRGFIGEFLLFSIFFFFFVAKYVCFTGHTINSVISIIYLPDVFFPFFLDHFHCSEMNLGFEFRTAGPESPPVQNRPSRLFSSKRTLLLISQTSACHLSTLEVSSRSHPSNGQPSSTGRDWQRSHRCFATAGNQAASNQRRTVPQPCIIALSGRGITPPPPPPPNPPFPPAISGPGSNLQDL